MSEQFDFDTALAALQNGQNLTGSMGMAIVAYSAAS